MFIIHQGKTELKDLLKEYPIAVQKKLALFYSDGWRPDGWYVDVGMRVVSKKKGKAGVSSNSCRNGLARRDLIYVKAALDEIMSRRIKESSLKTNQEKAEV